MRLLPTERIQEDFVESFGFNLEGRAGFERSGVGLGRTFQREGMVCAKAEVCKCQHVCGQQYESSGESRELGKGSGGICPVDEGLSRRLVDKLILRRLKLRIVQGHMASSWQ